MLSKITSFIVTFLLLPVLLFSFEGEQKLSKRLQEQLETKSKNDYHDVGLLLKDRVDVTSLSQRLYSNNASLKKRAKLIITRLQQKATVTQEPLVQYLKGTKGVKDGSIRQFWVTNIVYVKLRKQVVQELAAMEEIGFMDINAELKLDQVKKGNPPTQKRQVPGGHEPGHDAINAPQMWAMGYTGYGTTAMGLDTGVEPEHPALSDNWRGNFKPLQQSWFVNGAGATKPADCSGTSSHGTHTMGTMVGMDPSRNDTVGVAFGARWIGSPTICGGGSATSDNLAGFQWALDPDGDPSTITDMPDVINNSWFDPTTRNECNGIYKNTFDNVEAAGIAIVFSAGNDGPNPSTITAPKNINTSLTNVFSVGNINGNFSNYPIRNSSSRGPAVCNASDSSLVIKPEVVAPGFNVRSSTFTSGYSFLTGTSMAAPHVSGAILLLKEAFPQLTGKQIKEALYFSAIDLGPTGEDNDYGMGLIDVPAAYNYLLNQGFSPADFSVDASISAIKGISEEMCNNSISPSIIVKNKGDSTITSFELKHGIAQNSLSSISWSGSLQPQDSIVFTLPPQNLSSGNFSYQAEIINPNNQQDSRKFNNSRYKKFSILGKAKTQDGGTCGKPFAVLSARSFPNGIIQWYSDSTGGTVLASGTVFQTPNLNQSQTFYADLLLNNKVGEPDTSQGTGGFFDFDGRYLVFDSHHPFTLKSVKVYAEDAGQRRIEWRDSLDNVLQSKTVSMTAGQQRVNLNFNIMPGENYRLAVSGKADMYRHNSGVSYPYEVPGVLSIKRSNANSSELSFYYFFYDWAIEYNSVCSRTPAQANLVQSSSVNANYTVSSNRVDLSNDNGKVTFTDNSANANQWLWDFGDGSIATVRNPIHSYDSVGTFTVRLIAIEASGCRDTTTKQIEVVQSVGIDDQQDQTELRVYPNPAKQWISIQGSVEGKQDAQLRLIDMYGKKIREIGLSQNQREFNKKISLANLPAGVYYIQFNTNQTIASRKFVHVE